MIQPNEFRYTLIIRGLYEYVLPQAPKGWEGSLISYSRSLEYYGMIRTFTIPMDFVLDGAKILRNEFYQYGLEGRVVLKIEEFKNSDWTYQEIYTGEIDFSTIDDASSLDGYTFTVNVMEGDISAAVKAYEKQVYEIPLDVPEAVEVELTSIVLNEEAQFIFLPTNDFRSDAYPALQVVTNNKVSVTSSVKNAGFYADSAPAWVVANTNWFYRATVDTGVRVTGSLKGFLYSLNIPRNYQFNIYKTGVGLIRTLYFDNLPDTSVKPFDFSWDFTETMAEGESLYFYIERVGSSISTDNGANITEGEMKLEYQTISPSTFCKALRPKYIFDKLIELMYGDPYPTSSYHLETTWRQLVITCGDAIRRVDNPKIKLSFSDFFQSINSVTNCGFGIQNNIAIIEPKQFFFQTSLQSVNVGNVKKANLSVYDPYIFNAVKVGYPDQSYDTLNGKDEPNSTQSYQLPIQRIAKEMNLVSPIRADSYGIEFARVAGASSEATKSDNDNFFIYIRPEVESGEDYYRPVLGEAFTSITGLTGGGSVYNLLITPKRNLIRHGDYLHGILDKYDGYLIKFTSGLKNTEVSTVGLDGLRYTEGSNWNISALPDKLFLPYAVDIETKLPRNTYELIRNLPNGYIRYTLDGNDYRGFIIDASVDVSKNTPREFKLLLTRENNLLNLIRE